MLMPVVSHKPKHHKPFRRKSLLQSFHSKHRWKTDAYLDGPYYRRSRTRSLMKNLCKTYRSLQDSVHLLFRLFIFIDQVIRAVFNFIDNLNRIVCAVYGWIQMLYSVCSALHLIASRLMMLSSAVYRIFHLLAILLEPFSNRSFENAGRAFSHWFFDYYSSNGACYTLKARTHHIVRRVRARWKKDPNLIDEEDVYYDALDEEGDWFGTKGYQPCFYCDIDRFTGDTESF